MKCLFNYLLTFGCTVFVMFLVFKAIDYEVRQGSYYGQAVVYQQGLEE